MADTPAVKKGSTGQFQRQGQTAGPYGQDPNLQARGDAAKEPRELKP